MIFPSAFLLVLAGALLAGAPAEAQSAPTPSTQPPAAAGSAVPAGTQSPSVPASGPTGASQTPDKASSAQAPAATLPAGAAPSDTASAEKSTAGTGSALIPHDLSPVGMFMHADVVVKAVMIGLAIASLATWTILLAKAVELMSARSLASRGLSRIAAAPSLRDAAVEFGTSKAPAARLVAAALDENDRSRGLSHEGIKERTVALLGRIESRAGRAMGRGTGILATIGSTAPFVGLFGTVWGIMNSFIGISKTNTTNLAVVAPGIAEALLATATGLVAAIPAVIIYNLFARSITGYRQILADASTEVLRLQSRDLDRGELDRLPHGVARQQAAE